METRQDILDKINAEASKHTELAELQKNVSSTAWWLAIKNIVSFVVWLILQQFKQLKKDIDAQIQTTELGLEDWYKEMIYAYQHGDKLVVINNRPTYLEVDKSKRIISRGSVRPLLGGGVRIKIATGEDTLQKPSEAILAGFSEYVNKQIPFGTSTEIIGLDANQFKLDLTVELDATVFDSDGKSLVTGKFEVKEAAENYLRKFDFDGSFYLSKLVDEIQKIAGVKDVHINSAALDGTAFTRKIQEVPAGHMVLTSDSVFKYVFD